MTVSALVARLAGVGRIRGWGLLRLTTSAVLRHEPSRALEVVAAADLPLFVALLRLRGGDISDLRSDATAALKVDWAQLGDDWHGAFLDFGCAEVLALPALFEVVVSVGSSRIRTFVDAADFDNQADALAAAKRRAGAILCGLFLDEAGIWNA